MPRGVITTMKSSLPGASILLIVLFSLVSCQNWVVRDTYDIQLPEMPPSVIGQVDIVFWQISWLDFDGTVKILNVYEEDRPRLNLAREFPIVISFLPIINDEPFQFHPAGYLALQPPSETSTLVPGWSHGFAADYMLKLASHGINPGTVNIERFREGVITRSQGNPWFLDTRRLSTDLLSGNLWVYSIRQRETHPVILPLSPGLWLCEYLLDPSLEVANDGWFGVLPAGTFHFLRPADGTVCTVGIGDKGIATLAY